MNHSLPLHGEIRAGGPPARFAIARKGFRPFFLLAAVFACAIVPAWLLVIFGILRPTAYIDATTWHAHEMIFGFVVVVIAGFLLTAVGNWTQRETAVGARLLALSAVWVAGASWTAAFEIYVVAYAPILSRPRVDGKPG